MKEQTCCFSGHRNLPADDIYKIKRTLKATILSLIKDDIIYYGCGGARGFDLLAAQIILELKEIYPELRLIMVYPCRNQTRYWNEEDRKIYDNIKNKSDKCVYIANDYDDTCMAKRNRHLINNSSFCICYLNHERSGTGYTIDYAEKKGLKIINIANQKRSP